MEFSKYNLEKELVDILFSLGYKKMSEVQNAIIPSALKGESLIVKAKTGSGKTHSFLIPLLARIIREKGTQALILSPTRELARQIYDFAQQINKLYRNIDILLLAGGLEKSRNKERLGNKPNLIIATPGRFKDLMLTEDIISYKTIETLVLDEGDMLLDGGFFDIISEIIDKLEPKSIQLFSATIPQKLANLVSYKTGVRKISDVDKHEKTSGSVKHYLIDVHHQERFPVVETFIKAYNPYLLLVFASTNKEVMALYEYLSANGYKVGLLTGELESRKRKAMFRRVKNNEFQIIVASDIAARGIDILDVSHVLSVSFPYDLDFYFHRAGRTGRNQNDGLAFTMYDHDDLQTVEKVEKMGVVFEVVVYKNGEFIPGKKKERTIKSVTPEQTELDIKIRKTVGATKKRVVKPAYKKKVKQAVERVKKAHKRAEIKKSLKAQRAKRSRGGTYE